MIDFAAWTWAIPSSPETFYMCYWLLSAELDECWFKFSRWDTRGGAALRQTTCVPSTNRLRPLDRRGRDMRRPDL